MSNQPHPWHERLEVIRGDITKLAVDAIVNAANSSLLGGGGVDGAIHRAAGSELRAECAALGGCPTGEARITKGYRLPARHIIHTVGPVWSGGGAGEDADLARCYRSCFALVERHGLRSVAFPSISTGAYRFPVERAARIALDEIRAFLERNAAVEKVIVVCFEEAVYNSYQAALARLSGGRAEGQAMSGKSRRELLEEMLAETPEDAELRYAVAMEYVSAGADAEAVNRFRELFAQAPDYAPAYHQAGLALARLGRIGEARDVLARGVAAARRGGNAHAAEEMQGFLDTLR
jgi:O-acetyl-ADP-ribose deacetylase (regulator of RNase III)